MPTVSGTASRAVDRLGQQSSFRDRYRVVHRVRSQSLVLLSALSLAMMLTGVISTWSYRAHGAEPAASRTTASDRRARATLSPADEFRSEIGDRVFFPEGSADLGGRARVALQAQAVWLLKHPEVRLIVEGHSNDPGDDGANQRLSEARAEAVRLRLLEHGVAPERIIVVGFGKARPAATCDSSACAAHNRRVVTQIGAAQAERDTATAPGPVGVRPSLRRLF